MYRLCRNTTRGCWGQVRLVCEGKELCKNYIQVLSAGNG